MKKESNNTGIKQLQLYEEESERVSGYLWTAKTIPLRLKLETRNCVEKSHTLAYTEMAVVSWDWE